MFRFFSRKPELGPQPLFRFYDGALRSRPDNVTIIDMHHSSWRGDYDTLMHPSSLSSGAAMASPSESPYVEEHYSTTPTQA